MNVLWASGSGTVDEVRQGLEDPLAYTTVLSLLRTLEEKGHVRHEQEGRAHRYFPVLERSAAGEGALGLVLDKLFRGSPELLLTHLVEERNLSREELARMRALLDERLKRGRS